MIVRRCVHFSFPDRSTMTRSASAALALYLGLVLIVCAHAQSSIVVDNAWARATVPGQSVGAVYFEIRSAGPASLIGASTPIARRAEMHSMSNEGGVMKMRALSRVELPAGQTVTLGPNGNHIMLLDLKHPLQAGATVPLVLIVEQKGKKKEIQVQAEVRAIAP